MSEKNTDFFQQFVDEYTNYSRNETLPTTADQDVKYGLLLQAERAKQLGYKIEYDMEPQGVFANGGGKELHWRDEVYDNSQQYRTYQCTKTISKNGATVYHKTQEETFYEIVTDYIHPEPIAEELYTCPNCGAIVQVKELEEGCPYCGSHFSMRELFPKVTNFFRVSDLDSNSKSEIKQSVYTCVIIFGLYAFFFLDLNSPTLPIQVIKSSLFGLLAGGFMGYLLWFCRSVGRNFYETGRAIGPLMGIMGSRKKFINYMRQYTPEFSYEYFSGKICSLIQTIIYSDSENQIPYYQGEALDDKFKDILESNMFGSPVLKKFTVNDDCVHLTLKVYMDNTHATKKGVKFTRDTYHVELYRKLRKPYQYNFSIHRVSCKTCNGSFDAGKHTDCPYCGSPYPYEEDEWIITKIETVN